MSRVAKYAPTDELQMDAYCLYELQVSCRFECIGETLRCVAVGTQPPIRDVPPLFPAPICSSPPLCSYTSSILSREIHQPVTARVSVHIMESSWFPPLPRLQSRRQQSSASTLLGRYSGTQPVHSSSRGSLPQSGSKHRYSLVHRPQLNRVPKGRVKDPKETARAEGNSMNLDTRISTFTRQDTCAPFKQWR